MNHVRNALRASLLALACLAAAWLAPASASAATEWQVTSVHGPQNMPPGDASPLTPEGQYMVQVRNIGDADSDGTAVTVTDELPPGVTATGVSGPDWTCGGIGTGVVSCESTEVVEAPATDVERRGLASDIYVTVSVDPGASGVHPNEVSVSGGGGAAATGTDPTLFSAAPAGFGFVPGSFRADIFDAVFPGGAPVRQAGSHPFELRVDFDTNLAFGHDPDDGMVGGDFYYTEPDEHVKTLETRLPRGFVGNPEATPKCAAEDLTAVGVGNHGQCPPNSQVGVIDIVTNDGKRIQQPHDLLVDVPVYNMEPPPGTVAAFGFSVLGHPIWIDAALDPSDGYSVVTTVRNAIALLPMRSVRLTLWGVPADPAHDSLRLNSGASDGTTAIGFPSTAPTRPFLTLPSRCDAPGAFRQVADSWHHPGAFTPEQVGPSIDPSGCEDPRIRFQPRIAIQPTSREAASPTGLEVDLHVPQKDDTVAGAAALYEQNGDFRAIVTPHLKDAVTTLPPGMAVNPSIADGLTGCSQADVGLDDNDAPRCPDSSKIGTVEIESSLVPDTLRGSIYQAKQHENPHGSLLAFYTVARGSGLTIKLAAKVVADPETGQLSTIFLDNPQLPFDHYRLRFNGGQRAPLVNPPTCGTHTSTARFTAWNSSVAPVETGDTMQITSGPNGGPCVGSLAERPFAPGFDAKSLLPIAGAFSDFGLDVSREDGTQELRTIETVLPPGMLARLAGVPYCPEASLAAISAAPGSGLGERLSPSCPAASLVGQADAAAGAGALPFHNPGNVYLTGPYKGAPLGLAVVTPIVAGPLDLGSIVVRAALHVDPVTTQARVLSDPIPDRIVADGNGFPLNLRSVRVVVDRDQFTLNPTSCDPMAVDGLIGSLQGALAPVSERFQVGACAALGFKPKLSLRLFGQTRRGGHPRLRATLTMPPGGANIARAAVALPRSEFLDQSHIRTICTRVQFAADRCPAGSVYGRARAFTPLLDRPLEGPVYLRSSNHKLPDLVADLGGQISVELSGRIDSTRGRGIRTTFDVVPDAPVRKFVLEMRGGKKGLLENSRDLCARPSRATARFDAHSGKIADLRPKLKASCGGKAQRHTKHKR